MNIIVKKIGAEWYRQMLFNNRVQQSLSKTREKRLTILNSERLMPSKLTDNHTDELEERGYVIVHECLDEGQRQDRRRGP